VGILVTGFMAYENVAGGVRFLESVPDRNNIPEELLELAVSLVNFAVGPPIPSRPCDPTSDICDYDFIWIRKDVCLRITTHLDDDENLKASIGELVHHINTIRDIVGAVYGVACSIFHCAVVRVDKGESGTSFSHTPALQFLPSFYARKISTPGMEALSRLGCLAGGEEFLSAISEAYNLPRTTHKELLDTRSVTARVPVELWANIGQFLTSPKDLVTLASISRRTMSVAADLVRYPSVMEFRLVDVVGSIPTIPETTARTSEEVFQDYYRQLGCAKFAAVKGGRRVTVELGQAFGKISARSGRIPFKVETYMGKSMRIGLYVWELDDDGKAK
jgi:hypothetical protein